MLTLAAPVHGAAVKSSWGGFALATDKIKRKKVEQFWRLQVASNKMMSVSTNFVILVRWIYSTRLFW
jgi:hypothetical protein